MRPCTHVMSAAWRHRPLGREACARSDLQLFVTYSLRSDACAILVAHTHTVCSLGQPPAPAAIYPTRCDMRLRKDKEISRVETRLVSSGVVWYVYHFTSGRASLVYEPRTLCSVPYTLCVCLPVMPASECPRHRLQIVARHLHIAHGGNPIACLLYRAV